MRTHFSNGLDDDDDDDDDEGDKEKIPEVSKLCDAIIECSSSPSESELSKKSHFE